MYITDQQFSGRGCFGDVPAAGPGRTADKPTTSELKRSQRLKEMAEWPHIAHSQWKGLDAAERNLVVLQMAAKYGADFAKRFLSEIGKRKPEEIVSHHFGPGVGPKPPRLLEQGYKLAQKDIVNEWWVHPSGEVVYRNYTNDVPRPTPRPAPPVPPRSAFCKEVDTFTESICSNTEKICRIAGQVNDEWSLTKCKEAQESCAAARQKSASCAN